LIEDVFESSEHEFNLGGIESYWHSSSKKSYVTYRMTFSDTEGYFYCLKPL